MRGQSPRGAPLRNPDARLSRRASARSLVVGSLDEASAGPRPWKTRAGNPWSRALRRPPSRIAPRRDKGYEDRPSRRPFMRSHRWSASSFSLCLLAARSSSTAAPGNTPDASTATDAQGGDAGSAQADASATQGGSAGEGGEGGSGGL